MENNTKTNFLNPYTLVSEFGLRKGMSVADFGSGPGHWSMAMAKVVGKEGRVHALDVRESVLQVLEGHMKMEGLFQIETAPADLEKKEGSGLLDNSQDMVLCSNTLHQLEHPGALLEEAYRTLKKGGKLVLIDWEEDASMGPKDRVAREKAEKLAKDAGFQKKQEFDLADTMHYGLVFIK